MQLECPVVGRRPQHAASTSAYVALSSARWYPSSSRLVRLSAVSPAFLFLFSFRWVSSTQCPSVISYPADAPCPGPLPSSDLFNHVCDLCLFSYSDVSLSRYMMFNIHLSIFASVAASFFFAWVVNAHI